jgi:imidazolonepropionase-like amidohydrolase
MKLTARWLFDSQAGAALTDHEVEVEDGRIAVVRPRRRAPRGDVVDFGEATLLPGLIDIHQHLAFDASAEVVDHLQSDDDTTLLLRMRLAAQRALAAGITTIRDLGDRSYLGVVLRDWFAEGHEPGPRIIASGPPLTVTGGHCWFLGGEADSVEGLRQAVRDHAARGVDLIKIMGTGGVMTPTLGPHESQYNVVELRAAVEEAHAHGLPVAVHAHGPQGIADAVAAGADSIEHCTFFTAEGVDADPAIVDAVIGSGKTVSLTAASLPGVRPTYPAMAQRIEAVRANHGALYRSGARVVCSSDAGVAPSRPHHVLPFGVANFLPSIGMSNAEAILNVTRTAAEACGIEDVTGTLEAGKDADIVVVDGNPLEDIHAIHRVVAVFAKGTQLQVA